MMAYPRRCIHTEALWHGATDEEVIFLRRVSNYSLRFNRLFSALYILVGVCLSVLYMGFQDHLKI